MIEEYIKKKMIVYSIIIFVLIIGLIYVFFFKNGAIIKEEAATIELGSFLDNCEQYNKEHLMEYIQECEIFFNEDLEGCNKLEGAAANRCKDSIRNFKEFKSKIENTPCDSLSADKVWCKALKNNNPQYCEELIDEKSRYFCKSKISKDITLCQSIASVEECSDMYLYQKAFVDNDKKSCEEISDEGLSLACLMNLAGREDVGFVSYDFLERKLFVLFSALIFKSEELCASLEESDAKAMCYALVRSNREECNNALDKEYCRSFYDSNYDAYNKCSETKGGLCVAKIIEGSSF